MPAGKLRVQYLYYRTPTAQQFAGVLGAVQADIRADSMQESNTPDVGAPPALQELVITGRSHHQSVRARQTNSQGTCPACDYRHSGGRGF